ncbi:MAG TPA: hypothetical protein VG028_10160 [Terriglobia bacterium]|nr:hypothetical protein [Terriglobia bacterium]
MSNPISASRTGMLLALGLLSANWSIAQETVQPFLRKAADQDAAYYLLMPYRGNGYLGAKVAIKDDGASTIFKVQPGPRYHLKQIQVLGLNSFPVVKLMDGAPKAGEVFSQVKMNDWIGAIRKKYAGKDGPLKLIDSSFQLDHAHAEVSASVRFEERANDQPSSAPSGGR